jgi:hypothetical protein
LLHAGGVNVGKLILPQLVIYGNCNHEAIYGCFHCFYQ